MEIEQSPPVIAKRLWNILRIVFCILKKGISKSKLMLEIHMLLKRSKIAGKAMGQVMIHHLHQDYSCRSTDVRMSVVPRREYEFSCSNSPAYPFHFYSSKRKNNHHHYQYRYNYPRAEDINVVHKVFDMLNNYDMVDSGSPLAPLPGFGHSPMVRQLRVTDSPFPVKESEENPQVDKDAEEFIEKFYEELKNQGRRTAKIPQSPSPYDQIWAR